MGCFRSRGGGRFVRGGHEYAIHVRALLTHSLGPTLQPTPTIFRGQCMEVTCLGSHETVARNKRWKVFVTTILLVEF